MRKIHAGCPGFLAHLDNFLLRYVFEFCEQGVVVTTQIVFGIVTNFSCQIRWCKIVGCTQVVKETEIELPDGHS